MYVPIGNYILLNHEEPPILIPSSKSDDVLPYLDIFSRVEFEKIEGYSLELYEKDCKLAGFMNIDALLGDEGSSRSKNQKLENFVPNISEGELVCENYDNEKHLKLNLKGTNITSICIKNCKFNFGFPFEPTKSLI